MIGDILTCSIITVASSAETTTAINYYRPIRRVTRIKRRNRRVEIPDGNSISPDVKRTARYPYNLFESFINVTCDKAVTGLCAYHATTGLVRRRTVNAAGEENDNGPFSRVARFACEYLVAKLQIAGAKSDACIRV